MAPKEGNAKGAISTDAFLALCIKHGKEKLSVNFDTLAKEAGLSAGGAANKFRNIMNQFEKGGAAWANKDAKGDTATSPAKAKSTGGTKRKPAAKKATSDDGAVATNSADDDIAKHPEPAKKRPGGRTAEAKATTTTADGGAVKKRARKTAPKVKAGETEQQGKEEFNDEIDSDEGSNGGDGGDAE
ncbi:uncharacterized protein Z518_01196 [Rhinocladiella mackenziei CBS 650.93]|uniref:Myb-like DNA-binding domain-containing protein n=1 Tax=Rhinocladiella mackenziei CBS 650.93 TaxID=1442369 RepID=A0A0D2JKX9_9EURO|nr:uncharacterized protein Z518_01196 [Rhinocladiella mackenziei CBS 650.93]KIX10115.1 hypothetical protein Z518_01196 [Rhinocladiella mackenziei CBS 650.93]